MRYSSSPSRPTSLSSYLQPFWSQAVTTSRLGLLVLALGLGVACGGRPAGPSPVPSPASFVQPASAAAPALPSDLAPEYVRALVSFDGEGYPQRWEGAFSHCGAVDPALAAELSELSGLPQVPGPCNVEWVRASGVGMSGTVLSGTARALVHAKITLYDSTTRMARHELGHVLLGGKHSPRKEDLMYATPAVDAFSADELALLAWLYRRAR